MTILIKNASVVNVANPDEPVRGSDMAKLPTIDKAYVLIDDQTIAGVGPMTDWDGKVLPEMVIDANGCFVMPAWCDSHTHLVFSGSREREFVDKINGLTYADIAARGGGILYSAKLVQDSTEDQLFEQSWKRLQEVRAFGTGAIEIKSGYGLAVEQELKMLRVIKRIRERTNMIVRATFLGAHAIPVAFRDNKEAYIDSIIRDMLPVIKAEKLADYVDVFCENGFYSVADMERVCAAGLSVGLRMKVHVNQLNSIGGLQKAIEMGARSVDHLEVTTEQDIHDLAASNTIGTILPTAAFFLRMPYQPARAMIEAGAALALATDFNPGSSPSGNMNLAISLSCIQLKMKPEEAIQAATINGAFAMDAATITGSIWPGKRADLILTKPIPSLYYYPYAFGSNLIDRVMIGGEFI